VKYSIFGAVKFNDCARNNFVQTTEPIVSGIAGHYGFNKHSLVGVTLATIQY